MIANLESTLGVGEDNQPLMITKGKSKEVIEEEN